MYIILGVIIGLTALILIFSGKDEGQDPAGQGCAAIAIFGIFLAVALICGIIALIVSFLSGKPIATWLKVIAWVIASPVILLVIFELFVTIKEKYID